MTERQREAVASPVETAEARIIEQIRQLAETGRLIAGVYRHAGDRFMVATIDNAVIRLTNAGQVIAGAAVCLDKS